VRKESPDQLVLAIETTAPVPGAALARASGADVRVIAEEYAPRSGRAESLDRCIHALLERTGTRPADVTALAVVDGPGSYTALRVGLALARGIAAVDQLPVAACGSLELIAETCAPAARICALLDASQGKVYAAGFARDGGSLSEQHGAIVVSVGDLDAELERWGGAWVRCGDARLREQVPLDVVAPAERAAILARVGAARVLSGQGRPANEILPRYVGASGARPPRASGALGDGVSI